jgi:hypothetical protein
MKSPRSTRFGGFLIKIVQKKSGTLVVMCPIKYI